MSSSMVYTCSRCDAQSPKWSGRCSACGAWGTVGNIPQEASEQKVSRIPSAPSVLPRSFTDGSFESAQHHATGFQPLDDLLGGGLVDGSLTLLAGEPGAGKSTLAAQLALERARQGSSTLYVAGEESPAQLHRRLMRLSETLPTQLEFLDNTDVENIAAVLLSKQPALMIVDSIQSLTCSSANGEAGSIQQVKASAACLAEASKKSKCPVLLIGQVTKEGDMAGPRLLEHLVDTVLFLEGDRSRRYRLLRIFKHRFGSTEDVALLAMTAQGLLPVPDASAELLEDRPQGVPGSAITCLLEGQRPLLIEIQALVSPAGYGTPIRRATGIDTGRLGMILAVLGRRTGINVLERDVYANAIGGIDARDPSVDLALATAIASAQKDVALDPRLGMLGEVGLAGELRPVSLADIRLKEMNRLGFTQAIVPRHQSKNAPSGMKIQEASTLREAFQMMHLI